jgi:integrase
MSKHLGIFEKQTKSGTRYQVKWRRPDGTQAAKNFRTLREAKSFKNQVEHEKSRGTLADDRLAKVKFKDFAETQVFPYLQHSPTTVLRRNGIMKNYINPTIGEIPIARIRHPDLNQLILQWTVKGLAPRTIRNHLNIIRPVFKQAMLHDIIVRDPMQGIKPPKADEVFRNPLTPEQCLALLNAIDPRYKYAIHFALATGVRWSEFANLKIRDFKPLNNTISVTMSKTAAGVRVLPLDPEDTLMISQHLLDTGRTGADADSPLFTSPEGKSLHHSNFRKRIFAPACRKAGLENVIFHDLRGTHATMLVAEGHDAKVVQERMGHRSIATTLKYYAIATEPNRIKAAGTMRRYLKVDKIQTLKHA